MSEFNPIERERIQFNRSELISLEQEERIHPDPRQREEDGVGLPFDDRIENWYAEPNREMYIPEPVSRDVLAFPSPEAEAAYINFRELCENSRGIGHLSAETGLATYVYGQLWPNTPEVTFPQAEEFLQVYQLAFTGRSGRTDLVLTRELDWPDNTVQFAYQQVNQQGIPVLGSRIAFTYDAAGLLALATSTLFPVLTAELPLFADSAPSPEQLLDAVRSAVANMLPDTIQLTRETEQDDRIFLFRQWILPYPWQEWASSLEEMFAEELRRWEYTGHEWIYKLPEDLPRPNPDNGQYIPALRTPFVDGYGKHWALWLTADELKPLHLEYRQSHDDIRYQIFPRPSDAPNMPVQRFLSLGDGATTLQAAQRIHVTGNRFYDPHDPSLQALANQNDARQTLAANVFYHLWETQYDFTRWLNQVQHEAAPSEVVGNATIFNPMNDLTVALLDTSGEAEFIWDTGKIHVGTGVAGGGTPVSEPGFDGDVIAHEGIHAFLHYYYRPFFEDKGLNIPGKTAVRAFDEALAFYMACIRVGDSRWGEYAYANWANRQLADGFQSFANSGFANNVAVSYYDYGLWWAKILWRLVAVSGAGQPMNRVILKALHALAHAVLSAESATGTTSQQIFTLFNRIADAIYDCATPTQRQVIAQVWSDAGFTIPQ